MRISSLGLVSGSVFAAALHASSAHAQSLAGSDSILISPTGIPALSNWQGDVQPGVVSSTAGFVEVAFLRIPSVSHIDPAAQNRVFPARVAVDGTVSLRAPLAIPMQVFPLNLALTHDAIGPMALVGVATNQSGMGEWNVLLGRTNLVAAMMTAPLTLLPNDGTMLDMVPIRDVEVARSVHGAPLSIPFSVTTAPGSTSPVRDVHSFIGTVVATPLSVMSVAEGAPTLSSPMGATIQEDAYDPTMPMRPVFLDFNSYTGPAMHLFDGSAFGPTVSLGMTDSSPGFGNTVSGALVAMYPSPVTPGATTCVRVPSQSCSITSFPSMPLADIDVVEDVQYPDNVWVAASPSSGPNIYVASTAFPDSPVTLVAPSPFVRCRHVRIAPFTGESVSVPQHAFVVASCGLLNGSAVVESKVLGWVVTRPPMPVDPGPDAGTDAGEDASEDSNVDSNVDANVVDGASDAAVDASSANDATNDAAQSTADVPTQTTSFRGSGCGCRTGAPSNGSPANALFAVASLAAVITARRRRNR